MESFSKKIKQPLTSDHFMRIFLIIIVFTFVVGRCIGQGNDSAWISNYISGFVADTGLNLAPAEFIDEKGNIIVLSDFKGRILYIDIWTTWCVNCIANFNHSKKLHERLKAIHLDTSILFINICTEDSRSKWKNALKENQPIGINLYARDTSFYQTWKIDDFPRYLIIDQMGKIMSFNGPDVRDGSIDYVLYAATKNTKPVTAISIVFKQSQYFYKYGRYTNDAEGIDYENWFNSTVKLRFEHSKQQDQPKKENSR